MTEWGWLAVGLGAIAVLWTGLVAALLMAGRRDDARALATFIPDCLGLLRGLLRDPAVPRRHKALLLAVTAYLASPIDLVPDVIPVIGQLDDALLVALVLRAVVRRAGPDLVRKHWHGPDRSRELVLRAARPATTTT